MIYCTKQLLLLGGVCFALSAQVCVAPASAQSMVLGIVAPDDGDFGILGTQVRIGVGAALSDHGPVETVIVPEECNAASGVTIADRLIETKATAAVGFVCTESLLAALPKLRAANIPVITPAVRALPATPPQETSPGYVFRLAPSGVSEAGETARLLLKQWRNEHFAIIDDGTLYGRELAETLRNAAAQAGLNPVFIDTYRPQLENQAALVARLRRSGATHVFIGGERADISVIGQNARDSGYDLVMAGGESLLRDMQDLPVGTLAAVPASPVVAQLPSSLQRIPSDGYVLPAFAATQILIEAGGLDGDTRDALAERTFETVLGSVLFGEDGSAALFAYRLSRFDGNEFLPIAEDPE